MYLLRSMISHTNTKWTCVVTKQCPCKRYVQVLTSAACDVTLFGNRVVTHVIELEFSGWDHPGGGWALHPGAGVLIWEERDLRQRKSWCGGRAIDRALWPQAQGNLGSPAPPEVWKGLGAGSPSEPLGASPENALIQIFGLQHSNWINFCHCKPPGLW